MFRRLRCCSAVLGFAVLAVLAFLGVNSVLRKPHEAAVAASQQPSVAPSIDPRAVDAQFASFEAEVLQDAAAGRQDPVTLTFTQEQITARANQAVTTGEVQAPVHDLNVTCVPGQLVIRGQAALAMAAVPFTITAVPQAMDGKARLSVQTVDFGPVPVPQAIRDQITSLVGADNLLGNLPLVVTSFRAEQGKVTLQGTTRPT